MKRLVLLVWVACTPTPRAPLPPPAPAPVADAGTRESVDGGVLRLLFIGNSYTQVNDLPQRFAELAAAAIPAADLVTESVLVGGQTLEGHWAAGTALERIRSGSWSHVVLQEQSLRPAEDPSRFVEYARRLGAAATDAGAVPALYVTWARASDSDVYPYAFQTPDEMQDRLTAAYDDAARQLPGSVRLCVGEAFRRSLRVDPDVPLHQADSSHPTLAGTYLAAATFWVALTGRPVPDFAPDGLDPRVAARLRQSAKVGSQCADVHIGASVFIFDPAFAPDGVDGGPPFDFGVAGSPVTGFFTLQNRGPSVARLTDGLTLSPPFGWTTGRFPGGSGSVTVLGMSLELCSVELAPNSQCVVSVDYDGSADATERVTVDVAGGYTPHVSRAVQGRSTDRALLTVSERAGAFGCSDSRCPGYHPSLSVALGQAGVLDLVLYNRGRRAVVAAAPLALTAPFSWGLGDGGFPGGFGTGTVDGQALPYCRLPIAPGAQCLVTVGFVAADAGRTTTAVGVAYDDALGPVGEAARTVDGYVYP